MTRLLIFIFLLTSVQLSCQIVLTKDSFFLTQKSLPKNYKSIIDDTQWLYMGSWQSNIKKIYTPDSVKAVDLMLFDKMVRIFSPPRNIFNRNKKVFYTPLGDTTSLYKTVRAYHKVKGNKIVSKNSDCCGTQKIIYVDNSTLILEEKNKKNTYRTLYRRQT